MPTHTGPVVVSRVRITLYWWDQDAAAWRYHPVVAVAWNPDLMRDAPPSEG